MTLIRRARPALMVLPCLASQAQPAPDAWTSFLERHRRDQREGALWRLLTTEPFGPWALHPSLLKLRAGKDLSIERMERSLAQSLLRREGGAPGPRWLLLSPEGRIAHASMGTPDGPTVASALKEAGLRSRHEILDAFLKEHPDQLETCEEALQLAIRALPPGDGVAPQGAPLPEQRTHPDAEVPEGEGTKSLGSKSNFSLVGDGSGSAEFLPDDVDEARWGEVETALRRLSRIPGWEGRRALFGGFWSMNAAGAKASPRIRSLAVDLLSALEVEVRRDPAHEMAWMNLGAVADIQPQVSAKALVQSLEPLPHGIWPPNEAYVFLSIAMIRKGNWVDLLNYSDQVLALPPRTWNEDEALAQLLRWGGNKFLALFQLERWDEAAAVLEELRGRLGPRWKALRALAEVPDFTTGKKPHEGQRHALTRIQSILAQDPLPAPALPQPMPCRILQVGSAPWSASWPGLSRSPELQAWTPQELRWETLEPKAEEAFRKRQGWDAKPRWALLRGETLVTSGVTPPTAIQVADLLRALQVPELELLDRFIRQYPDRLDARRHRAEWVEARMPNAALEARLAEDSRMTLRPIAQGSWKPDSQLWGPHALQALPELEARLQRCPSDGKAWRAWLDWADVHPLKPSILPLIERAAILGDHGRWVAALPDQVVLAVVAQYRRRRDWEGLVRWSMESWERDVRPFLQELKGEEPGERQRTRQELLLSGLVRPLHEALLRLGRTQEAARLQEDLAGLGHRGVLGRPGAEPEDPKASL